jgi:hypothetical protein
MNCNDEETERILAKQAKKRKLKTLLFLGIVAMSFVSAMTAVTWVVRVERPPKGYGVDPLHLVEIIDNGVWKNYVCTIYKTPRQEVVNITLNDGYPIFVRFLDEPVVGRSYDISYCYNFYGGVVGMVLTYSAG